ncbi:hypothetical protein GXP71_19500 [Cellulomonas sp. H30R-01]|uniref:hypothetical protein n=1 Tax=Cellulomonas sp. H30R-01 TaxID=2704467 RepID=UPI00138DB3BC|nr:hypothetical protein [Cellulomonas sp. H30R-01]QHT58052.1 hypothetical protein GXP71_19500 [Cellulomonas sp. H30R-01]
MRARRAPLTGSRALVAAAALAALLGLAIALSGRVLLHQCVSAVGVGPWGVRLLLLSDASDCPDGAYAFGPAAGGAVLLLSVAVPVVLTHVALAASGLGASVVVARAARGVTRLLRRWVVRLDDAAVVLPVAPAAPVDRTAPVLRDRLLVAVLPVRGPPVTVATV